MSIEYRSNFHYLFLLTLKQGQISHAAGSLQLPTSQSHAARDFLMLAILLVHTLVTKGNPQRGIFILAVAWEELWLPARRLG